MDNPVTSDLASSVDELTERDGWGSRTVGVAIAS